MNKKALSVFIFGIYLLLAGMGFLIIPATLLMLLGLPLEGEVWIRIMGMIIAFLGYYYALAGRNNYVNFFKATIQIRIVCFLIFLTLILIKIAPLILIIFGIVDLIGAAWTFLVGDDKTSPVSTV